MQIIPIDDIDDIEAAETVRSGLDGRDYEIDLSTVTAEQLREVLALYSSAARKVAPKASHPLPLPRYAGQERGDRCDPGKGPRPTATTSPTAAGSIRTARPPTGPRRRMGTLKY